MKKVISILMTLVMLMALSTTAFAAESTTLRIADATERSYEGYQLLKLSVSLKTGEHHDDHEGEDHTDACYNYAYTVNDKYRSFLQEEALTYGGNYLWNETNKPDDAADVTDAQILQYLNNQTSDGSSSYGTLRQVADRIYRAILVADLDKDATLDGDSTNLAQGYWMFADVTDVDGKTDSNSLVMVDTKNEGSITVTPKVAIPTVEKKVKDIDDSEDSNISDNAWHDSADHDIGDTVPFKLTATLPSNLRAYNSYKVVLHDTLSKGLTLNKDSVKVYLYDTSHKADVDTDMNDYLKDVTASFDVNTETEDGCSFEVVCDNVMAIKEVSPSMAFLVYYEATLNEDAEIGSAGNPNVVYLEFSNDPYGTSTGKTTEDKVTVFTYKLVINKTDSHGHPLEGAGFTLYKKTLADADFVAIGTELKGTADAPMTTFTWEGLDDGDYKLVESTVPSGYNAMSDVVFSISATHSETDAEPKLLTLDGGLMGEGVVNTGAITKDVINNTGTVLPETGAKGTVMLISFSSLVVAMAAVFMITRKKMSVYED